jgi:hypothetical protein
VSKYPSIPDFNPTPDSMAAALRAVKDIVEQLAGIRQGEPRGSPMTFSQLTTPSPTNAVRAGDLWLNPSTGAMSWWTGAQWATVVPIVFLTQGEYDALSTPNPNTLYYITD